VGGSGGAGGGAGEGDGEGPPLIVEIHLPRAAAAALTVDVVSHPPAWLSRALVCRTLTLGRAADWGRGRGAGGGGDGDGDGGLDSALFVTHSDGAGIFIAGANLDSSQALLLSHAFGAETTWATLTALRTAGGSAGGGGGAPFAPPGAPLCADTADVIPPRSFALLQVLSPRRRAPGQSGSFHWAWATRLSMARPPPLGTLSHAPPAPAGSLFAPQPLLAVPAAKRDAGLLSRLLA
jgi:hypothetical protein